MFDPGRRRAIFGLGATLLAACERSRPDAPPAGGAAWKEIAFPQSPASPQGQRALLFAPAEGLPWLVALHGRGESGRGLEVGARGWRDDYGVERMHERLLAPPLVASDLGGFVREPRLAALNASLKDNPYRGLCLATPYTPDVRDRSVEGSHDFARFVVQDLLPRTGPGGGTEARRASTGIDGVSMGGRLALFVGLRHPEVFGSVGALQPAIRPDEAPRISALAQEAMAKAKVALRLVSSDEDPFLPAVRATSERLRADGVPHELEVTPGPHDYAWNRGPGAAEMLLWHERVLRGLATPR